MSCNGYYIISVLHNSTILYYNYKQFTVRPTECTKFVGLHDPLLILNQRRESQALVAK